MHADNVMLPLYLLYLIESHMKTKIPTYETPSGSVPAGLLSLGKQPLLYYSKLLLLDPPSSRVEKSFAIQRVIIYLL
jgi:hypothetical protein